MALNILLYLACGLSNYTFMLEFIVDHDYDHVSHISFWSMAGILMTLFWLVPGAMATPQTSHADKPVPSHRRTAEIAWRVTYGAVMMGLLTIVYLVYLQTISKYWSILSLAIIMPLACWLRVDGGWSQIIRRHPSAQRRQKATATGYVQVVSSEP